MAELQHTLLKYPEDLNNLGTVTAHTLVTKDYVDSQVGTNTTSTDHIPYWTGSGWASSPLDIDFATNAVHQPNGTFVIGAATAPTHEIFKIESSIYSANVASFGDITPITMTAVTGSNAIGFNARKNSTSDWVMYSTGGGGNEYGGFIQYNAVNGRFTIQGAPTQLTSSGQILNHDVFFQTYPNGDVFINQYGTGTKTSVGNEAYYLAVNSSGQIIESTIDEIADLPTTASIDNAADWIPFYDSSDVVDRRISLDSLIENAFDTQGIIVKQASGTVRRSIVGTTDEISVINANGTGGNPTLGIADNPVIPGTARLKLPVGTTAQRPGTPVAGDIRYNSNLLKSELYLEDSVTFDGWISLTAGNYLVEELTPSGTQPLTSIQNFLSDLRFSDVHYLNLNSESGTYSPYLRLKWYNENTVDATDFETDSRIRNKYFVIRNYSISGAGNDIPVRLNGTNTIWDGSSWVSEITAEPNKEYLLVIRQDVNDYAGRGSATNRAYLIGERDLGYAASGGGDNLGNHLATQNLDMDNNDIIDVDLIQFYPGATNNWKVRAGDFDSLIFDYNGFASTVVFETSGAISINDPSVSGYTFPATDGTANQILETDGSGTLSWVTPSSGGDDLGNHTATQDLNMMGYNINNIDRLRLYGSLGFWDILGDAASPNLTISLSTGGELIRLNGSGETITFHDEYTFPTADGSASQVLTTDGSGTVTWEDAASADSVEFTTITAATTINSTNEDTYAGKFVRVTGGTYTITLDDSVTNGKQFFFFYESGTGTITFAGGGTAGTLSKDNHTKINAVGMAVTVTKLPVGDDFALVGDLVA
jgi:hypothetical protein